MTGRGIDSQVLPEFSTGGVFGDDFSLSLGAVYPPNCASNRGNPSLLSTDKASQARGVVRSKGIKTKVSSTCKRERAGENVLQILIHLIFRMVLLPLASYFHKEQRGSGNGNMYQLHSEAFSNIAPVLARLIRWLAGDLTGN